jgi:hypothetical protein
LVYLETFKNLLHTPFLVGVKSNYCPCLTNPAKFVAVKSLAAQNQLLATLDALPVTPELFPELHGACQPWPYVHNGIYGQRHLTPQEFEVEYTGYTNRTALFHLLVAFSKANLDDSQK